MDYISAGKLYIDGVEVKKLPYMIRFSGELPIIIGLSILGHIWVIKKQNNIVSVAKIKSISNMRNIFMYDHILSLLNSEGKVSNFELKEDRSHMEEIPYTFDENEPPKIKKTCGSFILSVCGYVYELQDSCYRKINELSKIKDIVLFDKPHLVALDESGNVWDYKNKILYPWVGHPFSHIGQGLCIDKYNILCVYQKFNTYEYHLGWADKVKSISTHMGIPIILTNDRCLYIANLGKLILVALEVDAIASK